MYRRPHSKCWFGVWTIIQLLYIMAVNTSVSLLLCPRITRTTPPDTSTITVSSTCVRTYGSREGQFPHLHFRACILRRLPPAFCRPTIHPTLKKWCWMHCASSVISCTSLYPLILPIAVVLWWVCSVLSRLAHSSCHRCTCLPTYSGHPYHSCCRCLAV